jgi:mRNA interferase MazF
MSQSKGFPAPRRGEIWLVDWSPGRGSEKAGKRPALIIQNDHGNLSKTYPNTIIVTITTKGRNIPFHVLIKKSRRNGLKADSYAKCEQVLTISKSRLIGKPWGRLTQDQMAEVAEALKLSLALP